MLSAKNKLVTIIDIIEEYYQSKPDMLLSTKKVLDIVLATAKGKEYKVEEDMKHQQEKIVISCDASIKNNPGGPSAVGVVISFPPSMKRKPIEIVQLTKDTTNNLAEYSAVYIGLISLFNIINIPPFPVEVRSDSQLVIKQITNEVKCNDEKLRNKRDGIHELLQSLPIPILFKWRPRISTVELKKANDLAQLALGVRVH